MAKHSPIGASSAHRWMKCPGSVKLSKTVPTPPTSIYAKEGTAAHALAESCIDPINRIISRAERLVGEEVEGMLVTNEMADAVDVYLHWLTYIMSSTEEILIEQPINMFDIHPDLFGTADLIAFEHFGGVAVVDYKHGAGIPVEVENNPQLLYYALGASRLIADPQEFNLTIVQPRVDHPDGPIRTWTVGPEVLEEFEEKLKIAIKEVEKENPKFVAGEHCKFCPAAGVCAERKKVLFEALPIDIDNVVELPNPGILELKQISQILDSSNMLKKWLEDVAKYAINVLDNGKAIPDYKLVRKRTFRKWINEGEVIKKFKDYGDEIYQPSKLRSPSQMEKIVGKEMVAELCEVPPGEVTIAHISDSRPALETGDKFDKLTLDN